MLTNSFWGLEKDIATCNTGKCEFCMFGCDKNLVNTVRIETCAKSENSLIYSSFNIDYLAKALKSKKIPYVISAKPTNYLCNEAYYHMLRKNPNTVFVHIPSLMGMNKEMMRKLVDLFKK